MSTSTRRILVTGFEAFGALGANPTETLARELDGRELDGHRIVGIVLPVTFDGGLATALSAINELKPHTVLSLGLAVGRAQITPERIAINVRSTHHQRPDNSGWAPLDEPITDGPDGLFSTLPVRQIVDDLLAANLPAAVSNSAGTYVCNTVMYGVLDHLRRAAADVRAGFVHLPATPELGLPENTPTLPMSELRRGAEIILRSIALT